MALVIRMNVPFDGPTHYFVFDQGVVTAMNFGGYQEWGNDPNRTAPSLGEGGSCPSSPSVQLAQLMWHRLCIPITGIHRLKLEHGM